jgi:uncharacterized protein YdaU (DUF1376 family)
MNGLPYYKAYPRDFFEGTVGLDLEFKGAYRLILDLIYMHGGRLTDDPRFIAGHLGCSVKRWNSLRLALIESGKIDASDGVLRNLRADKELEILRSFSDQQREKARKPRKNNDLGVAMAEPRSSHTEPEPDKKKESATHSCAMGSEAAVFEAPKAARFDEFWTAYPHRGGVKRGKKPAEAKYTAAVRAGVPEQSIIDGAHRARGDPNVQRGYARDPATWLNQAGWEDDIPDQTAALLPFPSREEARREKRHDDLQRIIAAAARGTT